MDRIVVTEEMRNRILANIDQKAQNTRGGQRRNRANRHHRANKAAVWIPVVAAAAVLLVVCGVTFSNFGRGDGVTGNTEVAMATDSDESETAVGAEYSEDTTAAESAEAEDHTAATKETSAAEQDTDGAISQSSEDAAMAYGPETYDSIEELVEAVGFNIKELSNVPLTVVETDYCAPTSDLAQISYLDADGNELCYRKSPGTDDISGDYSEYPDIEETEIEGCVVTLKGDADTICLATWTDGDYAYSIGLYHAGTSRGEMLRLVTEAME